MQEKSFQKLLCLTVVDQEMADINNQQIPIYMHYLMTRHK